MYRPVMLRVCPAQGDLASSPFRKCDAPLRVCDEVHARSPFARAAHLTPPFLPRSTEPEPPATPMMFKSIFGSAEKAPKPASHGAGAAAAPRTPSTPAPAPAPNAAAPAPRRRSSLRDSTEFNLRDSLRVSQSLVVDFIHAEIRGDLEEVPYIGKRTAEKLRGGEDPVRNTFQLIGKFLSMVDGAEDGDCSGVNVEDQYLKFARWLKAQGVHQHRAKITRVLAEKVGVIMPALWDPEVFVEEPAAEAAPAPHMDLAHADEEEDEEEEC
jgi:hypothetical protein